LPTEDDETQNATGRISVVRDQHLVPLLGSIEDPPSGVQAWKGVLLERHVVRPGEVPEHEHPDLCLHLQLTGDAEYEWWSEGKNQVEHTRPGSLILLPPGTRDRLEWRRPSKRLILSVKNNGLADLAQELGAVRTPEFEEHWSLFDPTLGNVVTEMGNEAQRNWPLGTLYADLLVMGLETQLLRRHSTVHIQKRTFQGGLTMPRLRRAMEYMNANLAEDLGLEKIAQELNLSSYHFAREFRSSTGQTPYQYLLDQRMAKARNLLRTTKWPVQYVSALTGFRSSVNFVRTFRQRVGQTPDAWRKSV